MDPSAKIKETRTAVSQNFSHQWVVTPKIAFLFFMGCEIFLAKMYNYVGARDLSRHKTCHMQKMKYTVIDKWFDPLLKVKYLKINTNRLVDKYCYSGIRNQRYFNTLDYVSFMTIAKFLSRSMHLKYTFYTMACTYMHVHIGFFISAR